MQQDQFCITFGKENWNTIQVNKQIDNDKFNTPVKTNIKKQKYETISKTARPLATTQNIVTAKKANFFKQNNSLYENFYQQSKRRQSLTTTNKSAHKYIKQLKSSKQDIFNSHLTHTDIRKKYLDEYQHVSFQLNELRRTSEMKEHPKKYPETTQKPSKQSKYYNDLLNKYEIIKTSKKFDNVLPYQLKMSQHKEDMNRLDNLIERINQRISSSNAKFSY